MSTQIKINSLMQDNHVEFINEKGEIVVSILLERDNKLAVVIMESALTLHVQINQEPCWPRKVEITSE